MSSDKERKGPRFVLGFALGAGLGLITVATSAGSFERVDWQLAAIVVLFSAIAGGSLLAFDVDVWFDWFD